MARRLTIGRRAVAVAILADLLERAAEEAGGEPTTTQVAEQVVAMSWDAEYKPNADKLVLTLDASFEAPQGPDAMRSTPELATPNGERCPYISNGHQCSYEPHGPEQEHSPLKSRV